MHNVLEFKLALHRAHSLSSQNINLCFFFHILESRALFYDQEREAIGPPFLRGQKGTKGSGAEIMMFRRVRQRNVLKCACLEALFSLAIYTCYKFAWHFPDITPTIVGWSMITSITKFECIPVWYTQIDIPRAGCNVLKRSELSLVV